jgi:lysozyme family protein
MAYPFAALSAGYTHLLATMQVTNPGLVNATAVKLLKYVDDGYYQSVSDEDGIPQVWMATSFERESSSNFHTSPAQGDPLWERSVHVPRGLGPYINHADSNPQHWVQAWARAAKDAYHIDRLDTVGAANWSWERACFEGELFNGFGPRGHGINTGYLWACTNHYSRGKYVSDGVWNPNVADSQIGIVPVMFRMVELRPSLSLSNAFPSSSSAPMPQAAPVALKDARALQAALNTLGANPQLVVDDSYGRMTRRAVSSFQTAHGLAVDGIAGAETWLSINKALRDKTAADTPAALVTRVAIPQSNTPATDSHQTNIWEWLRSRIAE